MKGRKTKIAEHYAVLTSYLDSRCPEGQGALLQEYLKEKGLTPDSPEWLQLSGSMLLEEFRAFVNPPPAHAGNNLSEQEQDDIATVDGVVQSLLYIRKEMEAGRRGAPVQDVLRDEVIQSLERLQKRWLRSLLTPTTPPTS